LAVVNLLKVAADMINTVKFLSLKFIRKHTLNLTAMLLVKDAMTCVSNLLLQLHTQKWGFNDLERRKRHLCSLLSKTCKPKSASIDGVEIIDLLSEMIMMPLPVKGH
jgi:hypothetical protein